MMMYAFVLRLKIRLSVIISSKSTQNGREKRAKIEIPHQKWQWKHFCLPTVIVHNLITALCYLKRQVIPLFDGIENLLHLPAPDMLLNFSFSFISLSPLSTSAFLFVILTVHI